MSFENHLLGDERVLATTLAADGSVLYATNKRVIRYTRSSSKESIESLAYSFIVSVELIRRRRSKLFIAGMLLLIIGLISILVLALLNLVLVLVGILMALSGLRWTAYYQIRALGLPESEMKRWRTHSASDSDVLRFARVVQAQVAKRSESGR